MKIRTFIDRPILAGVISVVFLIIGLIGLSQLPVEQFPEIAPPTVSVSATYTGANAETVQKSVVVPLEEALNGVENMMYMTSSSTNNGSARITIYFLAIPNSGRRSMISASSLNWIMVMALCI